jgi:hypothetical protein
MTKPVDIENLRAVLELMREFRVPELAAGELVLRMEVDVTRQVAHLPSKPPGSPDSGLSTEELRERYQADGAPPDGMESPYDSLLGKARTFPGMED